MMRTSRSRAGKLALFASLGSFAVASLWAQQARVDLHRPIDISADRQLFIDDELIEARTNVTRLMHQAIKDPEPVIVGDKPWEAWTISARGAPMVVYDEEEKIYKMWYQAYPSGGDYYVMSYATSKDGRHWTKPLLGVEELKGSKQNNVVIQGHVFWANSNVLKDDHETNPERRYKSLSWDFEAIQGPETLPAGSDRPDGDAEVKKGRRYGICVAFSPDGVHWRLYDEGNPVVTGVGDTHSFLPWDENYNAYVGYFRPDYKESGGVRVIGFSTSQDFIHWTRPETILAPDELDPIGDEFYHMAAMKYLGKYIGFLSVYHNSPSPALVKTPKLELLKGTQQAVDAQLTYSRDGKHFIRVGDRAAFLPLGAPGAWDDGCIYASGAIVHGNEMWIYYGGWGARHTGRSQELLGKIINGQRRMAAVGLARLRLDGFVSLRAGATEGVVLTRQNQFAERSSETERQCQQGRHCG